MRLSRKRKSPTKRSQTTKRIRKSDESSAADALLMLFNGPVKSSNDVSVAKLVSNDESQLESEPACSTTENCSTTVLQHVSDEAQVNIFVLNSQKLVNCVYNYLYCVSSIDNH